MNGLPFRRRIRENDFDKRMKELDEKEKLLRQEEKIHSRERELGLRRTWKKPAFSKLMMGIVFGVCIEILIYAEMVMWFRQDLSALYSLISVPAALMGTLLSYFNLCKTEHSEGGLTYELAMLEQNGNANISDENSDPEPIDAEEGTEGVG